MENQYSGELLRDKCSDVPQSSSSLPSVNGTAKRGRPNILLGITGSVAAVKGPELVLHLQKELGANVVVLLTSGGENFWDKARDYNQRVWDEYQTHYQKHNEQIDNLSMVPIPTNYPYIAEIRAKDEWKAWNKMGDPVLHIQLRDWADLCIIAPLSAHTLAKLSNGLCDETLSCVMRAWYFGHSTSGRSKPLIVAPAMNTAMWDHPLTRRQLKTMAEFYTNESIGCGIEMRIVQPQVKTLACGEVGSGAMASVQDIVDVTRETCQVLYNKHVTSEDEILTKHLCIQT